MFKFRCRRISDRRKHKRVAIDAYVAVSSSADSPDRERVFTSKNISPDGIFLSSSETFPVGTQLNLKIHTPTTVEPINVGARVVRIAKDEKSDDIGMGLVFVHIGDNDKKELLKCLYLAYHYTNNK